MSALSCGICVNDYGGMVVPMHLSCCQNHICFDCAEKDRARQIGELIGNKKQIKCIYCNRLFHSSKETPWSVNKTLIEVANMTVDLSGVRAAQGTIMPMQSSVVTPRSGSSTTRRREQEQWQRRQIMNLQIQIQQQTTLCPHLQHLITEYKRNQRGSQLVIGKGKRSQLSF